MTSIILSCLKGVYRSLVIRYLAANQHIYRFLVLGIAYGSGYMHDVSLAMVLLQLVVLTSFHTGI